MSKKKPASNVKSQGTVVTKYAPAHAARGAEFYVLRKPTGEIVKLKTTASSTASMDKTVKRFAGALKSLAKR